MIGGYFFVGSFFKGKIGIMKKSSQKFVSFLYIVIDIKLIKVIKKNRKRFCTYHKCIFANMIKPLKTWN
jgi:hypothetical protein